jgi:hypothetical protein
MDHALEEPSFLGTAVVEEDQRVLNGYDTIIDALKNGISVSNTHST